MHPINAIYSVWTLWVVTWVLAAVWSARTAARPSPVRALPYYIFVFAGASMLIAAPANAPTLWPVGDTLGWTLAALTAAGFLLSWWARFHLGALWSGPVTKKEGHRVIDTGPYRFVRHPIYTGIILASFATAAAKATPIALAGAAIMAFGWYLKARLEERFLRAELGADAYAAYAARVPMLLPFSPV